MPARKKARVPAAAAATPAAVEDPEAQLAGFLAKYTPETAALARAVLTKMRARLPGAIELVYDNYNALAVGFGATERTSEVLFSIAVFPRWVSLFFFGALELDDSQKILKGSGKVVRHVVLKSAEALDGPAIQALMAQAIERAPVALDPTRPNRLIIKSISAKQRSRRPSRT